VTVKEDSMDLVALVERARGGDVDAFTELVERHQRLAHGSAVAVVHDRDLARDIAQDAFVIAWRGLAGLLDPKAFPAWLRGIVRRQALHALRGRRLATLAEAGDVPDERVSAEQFAEAGRRRELAFVALSRLPESLREAAVLRWVHDCSQAQIAAFLELPVSTVNNRLHAARTRLKKRMPAMRDHSLPEDFPARIGRIVRSEGPVIEARFEPAGPPELFTTLLAADEAGRAVTVQVVQHLPNGRIRAVARDPGAHLAPGMQLAERGEIVNTPLAEPVLRSALEQLLPSAPTGRRTLLETGIKVVDLLMPIARGGVVGLLGGERVGTTVVVEELVRRLATAELSLFTFVPGGINIDGLRHVRDEGYTLGIGRVQTAFFVADRPESQDAFDTVIVLSRAVADAHIYPAIDPLASRSRWLEPSLVGATHASVAEGVRRCLVEADALGGQEDLDAAARTTVARARRLRLFFAQPFFIAEPYTNQPGSLVPRAETVAACAAILDGAYDDIPEEAFRFTGGIDQVLARARGSAGPTALR
jgi:RNA polymerase sigma factor (sigma-70 family)